MVMGYVPPVPAAGAPARGAAPLMAPCDGLAVTANDRLAGAVSTSVPERTMGRAVFSVVLTDCAVAVGALLTGVTVIVTVALAAESTSPSFTLKVKLSEPL